jgi:hypothetical protein
VVVLLLVIEILQNTKLKILTIYVDISMGGAVCTKRVKMVHFYYARIPVVGWVAGRDGWWKVWLYTVRVVIVIVCCAKLKIGTICVDDSTLKVYVAHTYTIIVKNSYAWCTLEQPNNKDTKW